MKKDKLTKNFQNLYFAILIVLITFAAVVSCENIFINSILPSRDPKTVKYESVDAEGRTYILVITGKTSRAAYTGTAGDSYVLTIKQAGQPDKVSKGTVTTISADGITLKPTKADETFGVSISSGKMTAITGTITLESGGTITAPGTVTPVGVGGNIGGPFTSIADMAAWLKAQPANTVTTPYTVKLNVSDIGDRVDDPGSVGYVITENFKYVNLDLSGSTFTSFAIVAFGDCDYLTGITIPGSVTSIGQEAFSCPNLTSVTFQGTITEANFYYSAFFGDLRTKYLDATTGGIGTYTTPTTGRGDQVWTKQKDNTFTSVDAMAAWLSAQPANTIDSPYTVKLNVNNSENLHELHNAFPSTTIYINLDLSGSSITNIPMWGDQGDTLRYTNVTGVILPSSVTSIDAYAFRNFSITSIIIPDTVTDIGHMVFQNCTRLASATIGSGVTSISDGFFYNCTNLTSVTIKGTITESNISTDSTGFPGDLRAKYLAGGPGTYTTTAPVSNTSVWTKQGD